MKLKKLAAFAAAAITTVCLFTFSVSAEETVYEEVPEPSIEDYYDEYEEPDYYYSILEDGTAAITGYNGSETSVTVPSQIDGYTVTEIDDYAFYYSSNIVDITLPSTIRAIGDYAFSSCDITSIVLPEGLLTIGDGAFQWCFSLTSVTLPNSVTEIGEYAFTYCESLSSITLSESLVSIPAGAFCSTSLQTINIPASVRAIDPTAFDWCFYLAAINVNENSTAYSSLDGVLFNKDKTALILYPNAKEQQSYIVPDTVVEIGYEAFSSPYIEELTIPKSVTTIDSSNTFGYETTIICYFESCALDYAIDYGYAVKVLDAVANVTGAKMKYTATSAVRITWDEVPGATGYVIYEVYGDDWDYKIGEVQGYVDNYRIADLYAGQTYTFGVRAYKEYKGCVFYSNEMTLLTAITRPQKAEVYTEISVNSATLYWYAVDGADGYTILKYKNGKWVGVKSTTETSYKFPKLLSAETYYFAVKPYKLLDGKKYYCPYTASKDRVTVKTKLKTVNMSLVTKSKSVKLSWKAIPKATGYQVFRSTEPYSGYKVVRTITPNYTSCSNKGLVNGKTYYYKMRAYCKKNGTTYYGDFSQIMCSTDPGPLLNGVTLKSHRTVKVYNVQGKTTKYLYTVTMSNSDVKLLKEFAAKNFTSKMSRAEKLAVTLEWINKNVKYAVGSDWNQISGKSFVEAIFKYKKGQCAQYNGAMACMMAYLGYNVRIVQGYRGTWNTNYWQHFWVEIPLYGVNYIMETGNYGKNGSWMYFLTPYKYTSGYIRNCKNM